MKPEQKFPAVALLVIAVITVAALIVIGISGQNC